MSDCDYLTRLRELAPENSANPFFDVNLFLLKRAFDSAETCFHLQWADELDLNDFVPALVEWFGRMKYKQNQAESPDPVNRQPRHGVIYFCPSQNPAWQRLLRYAGSDGSKHFFEEVVKKETQKNKSEIEEVKFQKFIELHPDFPVNPAPQAQAALKNRLSEYISYVQNLSEKKPVLTQFPHRTFIITSETSVPDDLRQKLPLRFNLNGSTAEGLPVEPLIEIVNDYAAYRNALKEGGVLAGKIDEVVFVNGHGHRYETCLGQLRTDLGDRYFHKLILLGAKRIDSKAGFHTWPWTHHETAWLQGRRYEPFAVQELALPGLSELMQEAWTFAADVQQQVEVDSKEVFNPLNTFFFLPRTDADFLTNRYVEAWQAEGFHHDFPDLFARWRELLQTAASLSRAHPLKWQHLKTLTRKDKILSRSKQTDSLEKLNGGKSPAVIQTPGIAAYCRDTSAGGGTRFFVPFLYTQPDDWLRYYRRYRRLTGWGSVTLLSIPEVDGKRIAEADRLFERAERACLNHPDRAGFVGFGWEPPAIAEPDIDFVAPEPLTPIGEAQLLDLLDPPVAEKSPGVSEEEIPLDESLQRFLKRCETFWNPRAPRKGMAARLQKISDEETESQSVPPVPRIAQPAPSAPQIRLHFAAGHFLDFRLAEPVACTNGTVKPAQAVRGGDELLDFKIELNEIYPILETIPDYADRVAEIQWASRRWRQFLDARFQRYCQRMNRDAAFERTVKEFALSVSPDRCAQWLQFSPDDRYLFPLTLHDFNAILAWWPGAVPAVKRTEAEAECKRIREARNDNASDRELVTKLRRSLMVWKASGRNQKPGALQHLTETQITQLAQHPTTSRVSSVEFL